MTDGNTNDDASETSESDLASDDHTSSVSPSDDETGDDSERGDQSTLAGTGFQLPTPGDDNDDSESTTDDETDDADGGGISGSLSSRLQSLTSKDSDDRDDETDDSDPADPSPTLEDPDPTDEATDAESTDDESTDSGEPARQPSAELDDADAAGAPEQPEIPKMGGGLLVDTEAEDFSEPSPAGEPAGDHDGDDIAASSHDDLPADSDDETDPPDGAKDADTTDDATEPEVNDESREQDDESPEQDDESPEQDDESPEQDDATERRDDETRRADTESDARDDDAQDRDDDAEQQDDEYADATAPTDRLDPDELPDLVDGDFHTDSDDRRDDDYGEQPAPTDRLEEMPFELDSGTETPPESGTQESGDETDQPTGADPDRTQSSTRMMHPVDDADSQPADDDHPDEPDPSTDGRDSRQTRLAHGGRQKTRTPDDDHPGAGPDPDEDFEAEETDISPKLFESDSPESSPQPDGSGASPTDPGTDQQDDDAFFDDVDDPDQWELDDVSDPDGDETDDFFDDESLEVDDTAENTPSPAPRPEQRHRQQDVITSPLEDSDDDSKFDDSSQQEFEVEDTELFDSPFENDPICPRLAALEGPVAGQEFLVDGMRNSVGRATDNTVVVPDVAMSRRHFEIVKNPDESFEIQDLKAVNGTTLNGTDIKEAGLRHGDRIEAGKTVFQFLIPGEARIQKRDRHLVPASRSATTTGDATEQLDEQAVPPADDTAEPTTVDKLLLGVTIVAGLLCIPLLAVLLYTVVLDAPDDEPDAASELYFQGVDALQEGDWERAEQFFEQSYEADADFGETRAQLERIENERQSRNIIETARTQIDEGLPDELMDRLRSISRESYYHDDARDLLSRAHSNEAQRLFDRARRAYEDDDLQEATRTLDELEAIAPEHRQARRLRDDIRDRRAEAADADSETARQREARPAGPESRAAPTEPDDSSDTALDDPFDGDRDTGASTDQGAEARTEINFTDGYSKYRDRDFREAIEHFEAVAAASDGAIAERAGQTADDIETFDQSLSKGRQAREQGEYDEAIEAFRRARQADEAVAGEGGSFEADIADHLAATLADQGHRQLEADDYSSAFELYERARAHGPDHQRVRQLGESLADEANSLYIQAVNQQKSDPEGAARLGRTILTMVPTDHELHQRAQTLLDELD